MVIIDTDREMYSFLIPPQLFFVLHIVDPDQRAARRVRDARVIS